MIDTQESGSTPQGEIVSCNIRALVVGRSCTKTTQGESKVGVPAMKKNRSALSIDFLGLSGLTSFGLATLSSKNPVNY
jgi:hypothetical protein